MKKFTDCFEIISVILILVCFCEAFFILPDRKMSESENRSLAAAPQLTAQSVMDGSYTKALAGYFADQFPLRDRFVQLKAYSELAQLKLENNGVLNVGGVLIPRPANKTDAIKNSAGVIKYFAENVGVPVTVAALPRTADVYAELLPSFYPGGEDAALLKTFTESMAELPINNVDMFTPLCESNYYYRTDHHYTSDGAYLAYTVLADSLGYEPYPKEHFRREVVSDDFCGTAMRTSGFYMNTPDEIVLYRYEGDSGYTVTADGDEISLYDMEKLKQTDKYGVFLGGNHSRVDITAPGERPKLLVVRDSFADSLAPFLAMHFDLIMLDLRYFQNGSAAQIIRDEGVSQVLILQNVTEFCEQTNLSYLAKGIKS